jgi:signal transduction histidine kinase
VALDVAAALFVLVVELGALTVNTGQSPAAREGWLVVGVLAAVGVLLRRRFPLVLLAVAVLDGLTRGDVFVAMPFAAYAAARYEPRPRRRWAALGVAAVVALELWQFASLEPAVNNVLNVGFLLLLPAAVGAWVRTRAELMDALRSRAERAESEQQLRAREAVLEERTRITREMHDVVGHRVSLMVLQAGAIEMAATDPERVRRLAGQVQEAGRRSLEELRQLIGLLRAVDEGEDAEPSPLAPMPTLADVEELLGEARQAGVEVTLDRRGEPRPVDATVGRTAYRVVQEALTNAGKHAPGAAVTVTLDYRPAELAVSVLNRRATRQPAALPSGGHGLVGLRERVRTVGGELRAEPRLDGGFGVEAVLPA